MSYSFKELFGRLEGKVDHVVELLAGKANAADLATLVHTLNDVISRVQSLEQTRDTQKNRGQWRQWLVAILISSVAAAAAVVSVVVR